MYRIVSVVCFAFVLFTAMATAQETADDVLTMDLGFEDGKTGELPAQWFVPTKGWKGELWDQDASNGKRSAKLSLPGDSEAPFGNLMRSVDAKEHRGRRVRLSAKIRVEGADARAMMWFRVDRPEQQMGFFDNMGDRPIRSSKWTEAIIEGEVDADAQQFALGVMSMGGGTVYVDEMQLTFSAGTPVQTPSPPRAVTTRGLENLQAATRLLAYVRFFHPSDEAVAVQDWEHFAVELMEAAEPAESAEQLALRLQQVFAPIAPSLVVWAGELEDAPAMPPIPAEATSLRYWVHHGAGRIATGQSIYSSKQKRVGLPKQSDDVDAADMLRSLASEVLGGDDLAKAPESPYLSKSLGAGVCCRLPVMVYVGKKGSLPQATEENPWVSSAERPRLSPLNRSTRLAGVAICWGVMQHFYPYFDVVDTDWDAALADAITQAAQDPDELAYLHTLQKLVGQLHDGHGGVYNAKTMSPRALPVALAWAGQEPVVIGKHESAPEQVAVGDVVVAINGQTVQELSAELSPRISAATDGWRRTILCRLLRTHVSNIDPCPVRLRRTDGSDYRTSMSLCSARLPIKPDAIKPNNGSELAPGIVYFDLNGAQSDALDEVFEKLESADGIVFDLRGYPGDAARRLLVHLNKRPTASASWNVPVVTLPDREGWNWRESAWNLPPNKRQLTANIAFLTDGRAISYAESIMGIVEHYKMGEIVGSTTAGTNGNVNPFSLPGGYRVSWTGMKVLKHDGSQHHGVGIKPTVPVKPTPVGIAAGRDEVLEEAVEVLKKQISS
jgi:hypothetical protein